MRRKMRRKMRWKMRRKSRRKMRYMAGGAAETQPRSFSHFRFDEEIVVHLWLISYMYDVRSLAYLHIALHPLALQLAVRGSASG